MEVEAAALLCRLCADPAEDGVEIFSERGIEGCLPEKISKCLPILIREEDELPKGVCIVCQGKLEFCRQFFEQIYNATVKLLSILREESSTDQDIPFEEQMLQYVRSYASHEDLDDTKPEIVEEIEAPTATADDGYAEREEHEEESVDQEEEEEEEEEGRSDQAEQRSQIKAEPKLEEQDFFLNQLIEDFADESTLGTSRRKRGRPRKREAVSVKEEEASTAVAPQRRPKPLKSIRKTRATASINGLDAAVTKKRRRLRRPLVPPPLKICAECGLQSDSYQNNVVHWRKHHPDMKMMYKCDWEACSHSTPVINEVKRHRRKHLIEAKLVEKCDQCDKYYPPGYLLSRHSVVHQTEKNYPCLVCNKAFKTPEALRIHERVHQPDEVKFSHCCHLCGRRFTQKTNMEAHMRAHTGLRPFTCDLCNKTFSQKCNLDEHRRTHTGEKPYVCDICGSRHSRNSEMLLHIRCVHTHERPFQCTFCPKNFQRRDLLRKHERIHTDTRPYGCEFCGKTFTARDKMVVHRRLHTGERPYICNFCGRGFCESGNLKKHLRVHGTIIPAVVKQNNRGGKLVAGRTVITSKRRRKMAEEEEEEEQEAEEDEEPEDVFIEDEVKVEDEISRRQSIAADEELVSVAHQRPGHVATNATAVQQRLAGVQPQPAAHDSQQQQAAYPQLAVHHQVQASHLLNPIYHQIQTSWTAAMYSHIQQQPPQ